MQRSLDRGGYVYVYPYITRARIIFPFYGAKLFRELDFREIVVNDEHDRFACLPFLSRTMISLTIAVAFTRISQTSKMHGLVAIRNRRTRQIFGYRSPWSNFSFSAPFRNFLFLDSLLFRRLRNFVLARS